MTAAHGVVLLAAGASRRLGAPKQLATLEGETLLRRAARLALATAPVDAVVVVGARADAVFASVADLPLRRVDCADWASGLGASLRAGLAALAPAADGALLLLCDQPGLGLPHLVALRDAWRTDPRRAAASAYAGTVGVPALLPRAWFAAATAAGGDHGARSLLRARAAEVVAIADEVLAQDVDRPDDLAAARRSARR